MVSTTRLMMGDAIERMGEIEAGSVDLIAADLPYGTTRNRWDAIIPFEPMWTAFGRALKPNGAVVLTASQPFTSALVLSNPGWFRYDWTWDKANSSGHLNSKVMPLRRHEDILVFCEGRATYNPQMRTGKYRKRGGGYRGETSECYGTQVITETWGDQYCPTSIIEISNANRAEKVHPTQKPVALFEYLIRTYSNEGETVLDCTMGSGTTGVACINTGRNFIGIERDPGYFAIAESRIAAARQATPLLA